MTMSKEKPRGRFTRNAVQRPSAFLYSMMLGFEFYYVNTSGFRN